MKAKALRSAVLALCAACLSAQVLSGCARNSPTIVGDWRNTRKIGAVTSSVRYVFQNDGTYSSEEVVSSKLGHLTTKESGRYRLDGDTVALSKTSSIVNGTVIEMKVPLTETHTYRLTDDNLVLNDHRIDKTVLTRTRS